MMKIDEHLNYEEGATMKLGRANTPLCLLGDRMIIAAGGQISNTNYTREVEVYSIQEKIWF